MSAKIHGAEYPVQKIFSDDFTFTIPLYQRPYSWTTEQAGELLEDLLTALDNAQEPYFLGSIVLIKTDGRADAEVIDGQQRLTTLTILLAALRDSLQEAGHAAASSLNKYVFQQGDVFTGTPDKPRLTLRERDAAFFRTHIQDARGFHGVSEQLPDPQRHLRGNYELFKSRLNALAVSVRTQLASFVLTNCFLVAVSTPTMESAYRIFSVMNDRGLDLSHTDILKSEVIGAIPAAQREQYTTIWEELEQTLGRDHFESVFKHLRTVVRKIKPQDTLLKEFRTFVRPHEDPVAFIERYLQPYALAYSTLRDCAYESVQAAEDINALLEWLGRVDNEDWVPPALVFFVQHQHQPALLLQFFTRLERLAAGMMIFRANINERINRYAALLTALEQGNALAAGSPLDLTAEECHKVVRALDGDVYNATKIRTYILLRLDAALSGGGARYDHKTISIEHVLPQNPRVGSTWLQWFPDVQERDRAVHRLGNLVLLSKSKNSQAGTFDFDKKKSVYFRARDGVSPFALTTQVLMEAEWTPNVLHRRQRALVQLLMNVWQLGVLRDAVS
ncbi:DUF262 domain-containing protein [Deinococcus yavapaiensis]|uniref:Uncharacterized protein DUF1524 n=1 Tax=Deinococcus yavapaiensis KR-236 TaxID=694435 RepID=A0A318S2F5_9DEIO|nr:DUF262 domain-containing protein [Deinococcus yavapaiensis]PYE52017.1 uncharacterized protein DUF1524 [Deinococcus yavapaiensis KR-236]